MKTSCMNCNGPIHVAAFKGTGWCSELCRKALVEKGTVIETGVGTFSAEALGLAPIVGFSGSATRAAQALDQEESAARALAEAGNVDLSVAKETVAEAMSQFRLNPPKVMPAEDLGLTPKVDGPWRFQNGRPVMHIPCRVPSVDVTEAGDEVEWFMCQKCGNLQSGRRLFEAGEHSGA